MGVRAGLTKIPPDLFQQVVEGGEPKLLISFVSPRLVREVAAALFTMTALDYKRWESEVFGAQYNCGETFFPYLKAAYTEAAAGQNALMIVIS